jgi:hypothetical protein
MSFLKKILLESRESDFKTKYASKFSEEELEKIIGICKTIPNGSKFYGFLGRTLPPQLTDELIEKTKQLLKKFVSVAPSLEKTDINQYESLSELAKEIKKHEGKARRQVNAVEGSNVVYEDERFTVVNPITHKASCYYGAGTKWCTSSETKPSYFADKNSEGKLFYFIDKTAPSSNKFYKVALLQYYNGNQEFYDAPDKQFYTGWILGTPEYDKIQLEIDSYMQDNFSKEIEVFADKDRAQQERRRLQAQQEAAIRREQLEAAEERRADNEWDIDLLEHDDIGSRAHAFLTYCVKQGEDELTPEIKLRIRESKIELDNVNRLIDQTTDQERINELIGKRMSIEEMLDEYSTYIDVYNCIPEGEHYNMTQFSLVGGNGSIVPDNIFACSSYDVAYRAAKEYVEQLLDDAGLEAFNPGFVYGFIDKDVAKEYMRDFWSEDVYNSPEAYLDDSDRELSHSQEKQISELEREWEALNQEDSETEDEDRLQEIADRIDEIRDEIDEIKENPEGDYDESALENKINEFTQQYNNIQDFYIDMFGDGDFTGFLIRNRMINMDELIEDAVDTDGIGHSLNPVNNTDDEVRFNGETYVILRTE